MERFQPFLKIQNGVFHRSISTENAAPVEVGASYLRRQRIKHKVAEIGLTSHKHRYCLESGVYVYLRHVAVGSVFLDGIRKILTIDKVIL